MVLLETRLRDRSWDMELGRMNFAYEATSVPLESVTAVRITVIPQMRPWSENKRIAFYDGTKILLQKQLTVTQFMENRKSVSLLTKTRALSHVNCVSFIGVLKWKEAVWFANEHCSRGNLRNLIVNGNLSFDAGLREHIISDIIEGIFWIHSSGLKYHGKLQSKICLIDHHFTAKVAETAYDRLLSSMSSQSVNRTPSGFESFICTAPELRNAGRTATGTPAADIYSAGMIFFEIISESLIKSAKPEDLDLDSPSLSCPLILKNLVQMCWSSEPRNRPTAAECRDQYSKLIGKYSGTFVERLLSRMDAYAMTLEIAVAERTHELMEERRNCDKILLEMLPESIVELLRHGETVYPEIFEFATVSFSDLAGFPEFVTRANPLAVVTFLNESHSLLDQVASQFDVYKVETVNDSYLVVSGVPLKNGWRHGEEICRMALIVRKKFNEAFSHGQMRVRTGIHSGPCVTAVIGLKRPRYCLFGDTVNTASRMETQGKANKIQMSAVTASLVRKMQGLLVIARGSIAIKGKGDMETFWLEYIIGANLEKREGTQREHN